MKCVYLGDPISNSGQGTGNRKCQIFGSCVETGRPTDAPSCEFCTSKVQLSEPDFGIRFSDHLEIRDRFGIRTHGLRNLLAGGPAFLVCGGPSTNDQPVHLLNQRGIWSMAVNNVAGKIRTNSFVCSDPPSKFHQGIWLDKSMMKFVPNSKMRGYRADLREKTETGFQPLERDGKKITTADCPNLWSFARRSWIRPDESFFLEEQAAWGNHASGAKTTGLKKTVCTMLLGIRLLYYLGARRIYLVGVDWQMAEGKGYSFGQDRTADAMKSNNEQFEVVGEWLQQLQDGGVFSKFGLEIFNTFRMSALRAFAHVPFEEAIADALRGFPKEPFDLGFWYNPTKKEGDGG